MRQFATIAEMMADVFLCRVIRRQRRTVGDKAAISFYCALVKV